MTKEKLYKEIVGGMYVSYAHKKALDDFFDSNVCIPKGSKIQVSKKETISMASFDDWITVSEYRIKPPEPIYECQYVFYDKDKEIARSSFLTEHEYDISCLSFEWLSDIKSKRVRRSK